MYKYLLTLWVLKMFGDIPDAPQKIKYAKLYPDTIIGYSSRVSSRVSGSMYIVENKIGDYGF